MNDSPFHRWRKSTRSSGGDNCVEVAVADRIVGVRDSKDPAGGILAFDCDAWTRFVSDIQMRDLSE
ncbi:DUF397 domain-containing protein [Micromonospora andamanensis]|uniref:DUF397 domain-containing protein n=1 Tax=Micromonospora andamanensis TaxID=1287068 RepID=A0ABQ4I549_9ACTN|nr:DUF397 domain-containing protein [Micromonospora andamanensis]GIJ13021.1 hypothetical protein Van01_62350 [Micromonospora andamanensis]